jgi:hypothetical protein
MPRMVLCAPELPVLNVIHPVIPTRYLTHEHHLLLGARVSNGYQRDTH